MVYLLRNLLKYLLRTVFLPRSFQKFLPFAFLPSGSFRTMQICKRTASWASHRRPELWSPIDVKLVSSRLGSRPDNRCIWTGEGNNLVQENSCAPTWKRQRWYEVPHINGTEVKTDTHKHIESFTLDCLSGGTEGESKGPHVPFLRSEKHIKKNTHTQKKITGLSWDFGGFLFMCFSLPKGMTPKEHTHTRKQNFATHPVPKQSHTSVNVYVKLCVLSFPECRHVHKGSSNGMIFFPLQPPAPSRQTPSHPRELATCPIWCISVRFVSILGGFWRVLGCWMGSVCCQGGGGFCKGKDYHHPSGNKCVSNSRLDFWHIFGYRKDPTKKLCDKHFAERFGWTFWCDLPQTPCFTG